MKKTSANIIDWQTRFRSQPHVYAVVDNEGHIDGVYESKEAAQLAVAWHRERGHRLRVQGMPICTLRLSQERWT